MKWSTWGGGVYQAGKSYTLFTATTATGKFDAILPDTPGDGLKWNTSQITSGIISVDIADGLEDVMGADIRIYPTQVKNYCVIEFGDLNGDVKVELMEQVGKVFLSTKTSAIDNYKFNISHLHSGFYFIRITTDKNQIFLRKVIKM